MYEPIPPERIGQMAEDGSIARDVEGCAISGRPVLGHHGVKYKFGKQFIRVLSEAHHLVTDEWLAAVRAQLTVEIKSARKSKSTQEEVNDGN